MKKNIFFIVLAVVIVSIIFMAVKFSSDAPEDLEILTQVKLGTFKVEITSAGELDAKNSVNIEGPFGLRRARIWEVKIEDMVDEGTVVKKGDYVARLDPSELSDRIQNETNDLVQTTSQYVQAKLDTALTLRQERDNMINLKYDIEQKRIALDQSQRPMVSQSSAS